MTLVNLITHATPAVCDKAIITLIIHCIVIYIKYQQHSSKSRFRQRPADTEINSQALYIKIPTPREHGISTHNFTTQMPTA